MTHPEEIAANAIGYMAVTNNLNAAQMYVGAILAGVDPATPPSRRNRASPMSTPTASPPCPQASALPSPRAATCTCRTSSASTIPANVPPANNGYREMVNISKVQNMLYNEWLAFATPKWQGTFIVKDTVGRHRPHRPQKARSIDDVRDEWIALVYPVLQDGLDLLDRPPHQGPPARRLEPRDHDPPRRRRLHRPGPRYPLGHRQHIRQYDPLRHRHPHELRPAGKGD